MKFEMKIELQDSTQLENLIKGVYFDDDRMGKLSNKEGVSFKIDKEDSLNILFRGLHNTTVKVYNNDVIDGTMRFIVSEENGLNLIPCSTYCIIEENKYSFY